MGDEGGEEAGELGFDAAADLENLVVVDGFGGGAGGGVGDE